MAPVSLILGWKCASEGRVHQYGFRLFRSRNRDSADSRTSRPEPVSIGVHIKFLDRSQENTSGTASLSCLLAAPVPVTDTSSTVENVAEPGNSAYRQGCMSRATPVCFAAILTAFLPAAFAAYSA